MLFHEIYGGYFNAVARILAEAVRGELTDRQIYDIIGREAFAESTLSIPGALRSGEWPLITGDLTTPLAHVPQMPLTTLQKRWLKALLSDPRIRLFEVPGQTDLARGLEDVEPLYEQGSIVYFDQYSDGDPYEDEAYIRHFRTVLRAVREGRKLLIDYTSSKDIRHKWHCAPLRMEYSLKDDKFRLIAVWRRRIVRINIARIHDCAVEEETNPQLAAAAYKEPDKHHLIMELRDERNALERAMLHFSHLEKETMRLEDGRYRIELWYDADDETELLIRVLSFGPMIRVIAPDSFIELIRKRLEMQERF